MDLPEDGCGDCGSPERRADRRLCPSCFNRRMREYRADPQSGYSRSRQLRSSLESAKRQLVKCRRLVLDAYGARCAECGLQDERVLDLDHVYGGGAEHRRKRGTLGMYRDVIRDNFPATFRILCKNCNWIAFLEREDTPCPA